MRPSPVTFTQFHPGTDLELADIERLAERLSKVGSPRPLVFECWATVDGVRYFVGRESSDGVPVRQLLTTQLSGASVSPGPRPGAPTQVVRITLNSRALPLASGAATKALYSLHSAFQSLRRSEGLGLQVVIGGGRAPERTPAHIPNPNQSVIGTLLKGEQAAQADVHRRITQHRASARIDVTIRVGVTAAVPPRERALIDLVLGALGQMEDPGVRLGAVRETTAKWSGGAPGWAQLALSGDQLLPFLGWPVAGIKLPGQPDPHPRLLPPPAKLEKSGAEIGAVNLPGRADAVRLSVEARAQHVAITGGTGSGKSTVLAHLVLDDLEAHRAALLIDPKRQLVDFIMERATKDAAGQIVVIDATDASPVGVNPLDLGDRDPDVVVDGILSVFKEVFADGWGPRTEDLLHAGLLTLARSGQVRGEPHTLLDLPELLSSDAYRRTVVGRVQDDAILASFWATFDALSAAHRASILAAPMNKLRKYVLRKNVAAVLGQSRPSFRLRDLFKEQKVVLVPLNDALLGPGAAQLLGGLIVAEAWLATMERANESNPLDRPAAIYIDEVQRFMHLPTSIEDALATSRSYGVAWVLAFQGRSQVSRSFSLAVELNARNKLTFAASPNDAKELAKSTRNLTAEDFQELRPYELYANLVVGGAPAGWFSMRSKKPADPRGNEHLIRQASTELYGAAPAPLPSSDDETVAPDQSPAINHQRKRRS